MSRFFTDRLSSLVPYIPGEQPQDRKYIKLNTNESPFPPSDGVLEAVSDEVGRLNLYSDPDCVELRRQMSSFFGIEPEWITMNNGSDETLNFAFMAFADEKRPLVFPDITYGFYPVFADINHIPYEEIPLEEDFSINADDYKGIHKTVVIANPNAPTGRYMPLSDIESIAVSNPDNVVIVDEAYIDFGGESAVKLVKKYSNLFVVGTFSKSRSMAGVRLGYAIADPALIADINMIRYSTNPYNVGRMPSAAGIAALKDSGYYEEKCRTIIRNREWTQKALTDSGFNVIPSKANFIFAGSPSIGGEELYMRLKEKGILVRHFSKKRIENYVRISIGTMEQMETLMNAINEIIRESKK